MLFAVLISVPFLIVRLIYALLSIFNAGAIWDPLAGAVAPFVIMHSLMEYCVVLICLFIGYRVDTLIPRNKNSTHQTQANGKRVSSDGYDELV
jgi:hypothetical protein